MFGCVGLLLIDLFTVRQNDVSDALGILMLSLIGLSLTALGVIIVATRSLLVDKAEGLISRYFHVGPFKWRRDFPLSTSHVVRISWQADSDNRGGSNVVSFSGGQGDVFVRIDAFARMQPANDLASDIGRATGLAVEDLTDIVPFDPDWDDEFVEEEARHLPKTWANRQASAPAMSDAHAG